MSKMQNVTLLYKLQRLIFTFLGDVKYFGIGHPLWFQINAHGYKLRGEHYRQVRELILPGDIVVRRFDDYLSSYMLPGWWNHMGIYIGHDGQKAEQVVHAVSEGVIQEDILNFMRSDHMIILRAHEGRESAIHKAKSIVGRPYDFGFDFQETDRFSCTELVSYCYPGVASPKKRFGRLTYVADDFVASPLLEHVWDSRLHAHQMGVVQSFLASRCPVKYVASDKVH